MCNISDCHQGINFNKIKPGAKKKKKKVSDLLRSEISYWL